MGIKLTCSLIDENEVYRFDFVLILGTFPWKPLRQSRRRNRRTRWPTSKLTKTSSQKRNRYLLQPTSKERCLRPTIRPTLQPNPTKEHRVRPNATKGRKRLLQPSTKKNWIRPSPTKKNRICSIRWQDLRW